MKLEKTFIITLTEQEAIALKKLLGNFTDVEKTAAGLSAEEIELTREIYYALPDEEEQP